MCRLRHLRHALENPSGGMIHRSSNGFNHCKRYVAEHSDATAVRLTDEL
jgi:hypothetical protein